MEPTNQYYRLPENSHNHVKKMVAYLVVFFLLLILVVVLVVINAQSLAAKIPFAAEKRFVAPYEKIISHWYEGDSSPEVDQYLQKLADDLHIALQMPADYEVQVHYVDSDEVNAFATLGGHVFVFRGLLEGLPDENSLAMVLSHELAHIKHRDPAAAMGRAFSLQLLYSFLSSDYSVGTDLTSLTSELGATFFSREQEAQADQAALTALDKHYGHVSGFDSFFQQISVQKSGETLLPEWLSTHPDVEKRIGDLQEKVDVKGLSSGEVKPISKHIMRIVGSAE